MQQWEYLCVPRWTAELSELGPFKRTDPNPLGVEGWELVAVDDSEMHFKRPVVSDGS